MSISQVARDFGIPCKALAERLNGMYSTNKNGPAPIVDRAEEAAILQYIKYTHVSLKVVKLAIANNITLIGLPPHTTHTFFSLWMLESLGH